MKWQQLIIDGYGRVNGMLETALKGLTIEGLDWMPHPDCNSMGWLAWHLTRVQDDHVSDLMGEEQLWIRDKWCDKFNRPADSKDIGFGHTPEQVAAFKSPDVAVLLDYHKSVLERSKSYFNSLSEKDLDRELNEPWFQPLPTIGVRLISIMSDSLQHVGQIAYVRGLLQGKGWFSV
jgi:hypothetical protein